MRAADTINRPFDAEAQTELDVDWAAYDIAATVWHVVLMAFMACLMQWRDHHVAQRFYDGCRIVEKVPRTNIFRPARSPPAVPLCEYLAENDLNLYERKCQMGEDTAEIHDTLMDEIPAGFGTEPRPAGHGDAL